MYWHTSRLFVLAIGGVAAMLACGRADGTLAASATIARGGVATAPVEVAWLDFSLKGPRAVAKRVPVTANTTRFRALPPGYYRLSVTARTAGLFARYDATVTARVRGGNTTAVQLNLGPVSAATATGGRP